MLLLFQALGLRLQSPSIIPFDALAVVRPTRVYLLDFFNSGIQFYVLIFALSPFISLFICSRR